MSNLATLTSELATRLGLGDGSGLVQTLNATAFKGNINDSQMAALLVVANQYGLNPWTKEIYAFPDKNNGIVPVVGIDGWSRIINTHSQFDGMDFEQDDESCTCIIYRKDRSHPIRVTEWMDECKRGTGPWQSHPKRMLRHKAMIQCARLAFGYVGIFDHDEAERIVEGDKDASKGSGRSPQEAAERNAPGGFEQYEQAHLEAMLNAAANGPEALSIAFKSLPRDAHTAAFWAKHRDAFHKKASEAIVVDSETGEVKQ